DNDGKTDIIGRSANGSLYAYLNHGTPGAPDIYTQVKIGEGWNDITKVDVADIDNDGKIDILGRSANGILYAFLNHGTPGAPDILTKVEIGNGWNDVSLISTLDADNDGRTDITARAANGTLYAYLNRGTPGAPDIYTQVKIGEGWNGVTRFTIADTDADGRKDVNARMGNNDLNAYLNHGTTAAPGGLTQVTIGTGWHIITRLAVIN
ncbi:FG-GAP repeat domain-containing protein, partial [Sphaerisporangium melleum]